MDTVGVFTPLDNAWFSQDDSGGSGENFRIAQQVTPGTYIVAVREAYDGDVGRMRFTSISHRRPAGIRRVSSRSLSAPIP